MHTDSFISIGLDHTLQPGSHWLKLLSKLRQAAPGCW